MQNGIESINYEHSVNGMTEETSDVYDDGYRFGRRCTIEDVLELLHNVENDYFVKGLTDSAIVCARLRERVYEL